jgi:hypothetical protein
LSTELIDESTLRAEASELDKAASAELQDCSTLERARLTDDVSVVVVVVAVAEHPSAIEQVIWLQSHCSFVTVDGPIVLVMFQVEHDFVQIETEDAEHELDGESVVVDVAVVVGAGVGDAAGLRLLVEDGVVLLLRVSLKPLAKELASDKMLLQIAEYDESSEKGTMLQASPERVVVVVVAVA